jgi:glycerol kinase
LLIGMTRATTRAHVVRAVLEGIAFSVRAIVEAMERDSGVRISVLRVDGGPTANEFLMQFQADILGVPLEVARETEATARGAALLAGLGLGLWDLRTVAAQWACRRIYEPTLPETIRSSLVAQWERAVERCRGWATDESGSP